MNQPVEDMDLAELKGEFQQHMQFMQEKNSADSIGLPYPLNRLPEIWEELRRRGFEF
ncbi:hypothetical protein [Streptomyces sp. NPDC002644]